MKRNSPTGRRPSFNQSIPASGRGGHFRPCHEPLEDRRMLTAYINEIYFDPPGSGGDLVFEYIELRGAPSASLADHYLIQVENEGADPGGIDMIFDLGNYSFGSNGFLTLRQNNPTPNQFTVDPNSTNIVNTVDAGWGEGSFGAVAVDDDDDGKIENSGGTFMLIRNDSGSAPTLLDDLDVDNNGLDVPTGAVGWTIVDSIGVHSEFGEAALGRLYSPVNFGPEATTNIEPGATYLGVGFEIEYLGRWGNSTGQTTADWHVTNLTDNPLSGYSINGDFRQSGEPHGIAVTGRSVFYNDSKFDGNTPGPDPADSAAIATDKTAYQPGGGLITSASVTSYSKGLNGIMVDFGPNPTQTVETSQGVQYGTIITGTLGTTNISDTPNTDHRAFSLSDFEFSVSDQAVSANNTPSSWSSAPTPTLNILTDTPTPGTDRVELIWPDNAIENRYLEVTVKGRDSVGGFNLNTGLLASDVFYFGNLIGDTFNDASPSVFVTTAADETAVQASPIVSLAPIDSPFDIDRNGVHLASDRIAVRSNTITALNKIDISNPPAPPVGPGSAASAVASALAISREAAWQPSPVVADAPRAADPAGDTTTAVPAAALPAGSDPRARLELTAAEVDVLDLDDELLDALARRAE